MNKIIILDTPFSPDAERVEQLDDGTTLHRLFDRIVVLVNPSETLINWASQAYDVIDDEIVELHYIPNDEHFDKQWAHKDYGDYKGANTYLFWDNPDLKESGQYIQSSKAICIIDTGVAPHPDLNENRITINYGGEDVYALSINGQLQITKYYTLDDTTQYIHPHGTHVAGIAGGINNSIGICGTYFKNKIFSINVFEIIQTPFWRGVGTYLSSVLKALEIASQYNSAISSVNLSLGGGYSSSAYNAFDIAFTALYNAGILAFIAAGNSGQDIAYSRTLPAFIKKRNTYTIASSDVRGKKSWFSNYNYSLVACMVPGGSVIEGLQRGTYYEDDILSTLPADEDDEVYYIIDDNGVKYGYMAGTSMACPYACGLGNILIDVIIKQLGNPSFNTICAGVRSALVGASKWHDTELYNYTVSGGLFDASLLQGKVVNASIISATYNDNNNTLTIVVKNNDSEAHNIFLSLSNSRFSSPLELQNNLDLIYHTTTLQPVGGGQEYTFNIQLQNYYDYETIGILTALMDGNNIIGVYGKQRIYNIIECPIIYCDKIYVRCASENMPPFNATAYSPLQAGFVSQLAENVQKRLLFIYGYQYNPQTAKYSYFMPVATNGLCLNTINYPDHPIKFQCRDDATITDFIYAVYSMYLQLKDVFENGALYTDGFVYYVFDYDYWKQSGRVSVRRLKLPDEYNLDESHCRPDKIGTVVKAIAWMLWKTKVLFTADYTLLKKQVRAYVYSAYFENDVAEILGKDGDYGLSLILSEQPNGLTDPAFYYKSGYKRYKWNTFNDPYDRFNYPQGNYNYDGGIYYDNDLRWGRLTELLHLAQLIQGIKHINSTMIGIFATSDDDELSQENYHYTPLRLPINITVSPKQSYESDTPYNGQYEAFDIITFIYADIDDYENIDLFCCERKGDRLFRGGRYLLAPLDRQKAERDLIAKSGRMIATGSYDIKHDITCANVEVPVSLDLYFGWVNDRHGDITVSTPQERQRNYSYIPYAQTAVISCKIVVTKHTQSGDEVIYNKVHTRSVPVGMGSVFIERIITDLNTTETITVDFFNQSINYTNPSYTLMHPALTNNRLVQLPPIQYLKSVLGIHNTEWTDIYTQQLPLLYSGTVYSFCCYTRSISGGYTLRNTYAYNRAHHYQLDLRGLPVDDELYTIPQRFGFSIVKYNNEDFMLETCGWKKHYNYISNVVVDQLPPSFYPMKSTQNNQSLHNVIIAIAPLREGNTITYNRNTNIIDAYEFPIETVGENGRNYIMPNNQLLYKASSDTDYNLAIKGTAESNIIDVIGIDKDDVEGILTGDIVIADHYYHPESDTKIKYQFPNNTHIVLDVITNYLFYCNSGIEDYELIVVPDFRFISLTELQKYNDVLSNFDVRYIKVASWGNNIIVDQFPRGGVWFKKKESTPLLILAEGVKCYNIMSKIISGGNRV